MDKAARDTATPPVGFGVNIDDSRAQTGQLAPAGALIQYDSASARDHAVVQLSEDAGVGAAVDPRGAPAFIGVKVFFGAGVGVPMSRDDSGVFGAYRACGPLGCHDEIVPRVGIVWF